MIKIILRIFPVFIFLCWTDISQAGNGGCCGEKEKTSVVTKKQSIFNSNPERTPLLNENSPIVNSIQKEQNKSFETIEYEGLVICAPQGCIDGKDNFNNRKISIPEFFDIVFIENCTLEKEKTLDKRVIYLLKNQDAQPKSQEVFEESTQSICQQMLKKDSTEIGQKFANAFKENMTKVKLSEVWFAHGKNQGGSLVLIKRNTKGIFLKIFGNEKIKNNKKDKKKKKKNNNKKKRNSK